MNSPRKAGGSAARAFAWLFPVGLLSGFMLGTALAPTLRTNGAGSETRIATALTKPILNAAARHVLAGRSRSTSEPEKGRFSRRDVNHILRQTWRSFDAMAADIPSERVLGARIALRLACATIAAYGALVAEGLDAAEARRLTADVVQAVYEKMGRAAWIVSRAFARDPARRLRISTGIARRFPFGAPSYLMEDVDDPEGVAFDVRRCPIAEYFVANGLPELCVDTWCNQDYALAEMWGARLQRSGTLVGGADRCDFRWKPAQNGPERGGSAG